MPHRGFTLIELLIACALLSVVTAAVAVMAVPLRQGVERTLGGADMTGGSRVVLERLAADVREADSSASIGGGRARLARVLPVIEPLGDLAASVAASPNTAVRITRIPFLAPQGTLRAGAGPGDTVLQLETAAPCTAVGVACAFGPGQTAVVHDHQRGVIVTVLSVADGGIVRLATPLTLAFAPRAVVAAVLVTTYGLRTDPDGSYRLVRVSRGTEQPMLQSVVGFEVLVEGADPLHVQLVEFRLRVEAPSASMRGPVGRLFRRPGTSSSALRWVPDIELRLSVTPRSSNEAP